MDKKEDQSVFHSFSTKKPRGKILFWVLAVVVVVLGVVVGRSLAGGGNGTVAQQTATTAPNSAAKIQVGAVYGSNDTKTFNDTAEGTVAKGGIDGEGQYHLVRPGGESQYVYMTSSVVDLSLFLNRKVKVWGETQKAQSAGWLMDIGRVQVEQ